MPSAVSPITPEAPTSTFGRRLIPAVIDEIAKTQPERIFYYYPKTNNEADGYHEVSSSQAANAINRVAWWLEKTLGTERKEEAVGYMGPNDLRYMILVLAGAKSGYQILLSSPRNSIEGHLSLIKATNCTRWLVPSGTNVDSILEHAKLPSFKFPDLATILDSTSVDTYPYTKTFEEGRRDTLVILHTSGSTGLPKPIPIRLGGFAAHDAYRTVEPIDGKRPMPVDWEGTKMLITLPPFHAACLFLSFTTVFYYNSSSVFPPLSPITAGHIERAIDFAKPDSAFVAPSTLEEISKTPSALDRLSQLRWISSAGGPVAQPVGDAIVTKTYYRGVFGMTESYWFPSLPIDDKKDWNYFHFHPAAGIEFQPRHNGLYELVFVRQKKLEYTQPIFLTFPELQEWSTKDLWAPHPTKKGVWKYEGRGDDIIVLSNGEKFNPLSMEGDLVANPLIKGALVLGQGRFQTALLIEPYSQPEDSEKFIDQIWPAIEKCNKEAPSHAQIQRELVMLTTPEKPVLRTPKGTLQRRATVQYYKEETDELYRKAESTSLVGDFDLSKEESIRSGVRELVLKIAKVNETSDDEDFFALGMDSLMVLTLQRSLQAAVKNQVTIPQKLIYENPTISQLSKTIYLLLHPDQLNGFSQNERRIQAIQDTISKHSWSLPAIKDDTSYVIVTGTTGSLGSYILDSLVSDPSVAKVWCLNRSADAESRQIKLADERGLSANWGSKVVFLHADLPSPYLGLKAIDYKDIIDNVTHIIHNSWRVDFNLALPSFEPQMASVKQLLDTCYQARRRVSFQFISSIAVGTNWAENHEGPIPEATITDLSVAGMGYGESKLAAEHIVERAAVGGIVDAKITRVGQVAGPVKQGGSKGKWNPNEWLPTIVSTSAKISMLPSTLGQMEEVDWIPVDLLSDIVVELALKPLDAKADRTGFFHAVNPKKTNWASLVSVAQDQLQKKLQRSIKIVPLGEWVEELRKVAQKQSAEGKTSGDDFVTGVKLIDFYEALNMGDAEKSSTQDGEAKNTQAVYDIVETVKQSNHMSELESVGAEWLQYWLEQWGF